MRGVAEVLVGGTGRTACGDEEGWAVTVLLVSVITALRFVGIGLLLEFVEACMECCSKLC